MVKVFYYYQSELNIDQLVMEIEVTKDLVYFSHQQKYKGYIWPKERLIKLNLQTFYFVSIKLRHQLMIFPVNLPKFASPIKLTLDSI